MRANDIPARALLGRYAQSGDGKSGYGNCHCIADFYADKVGWVPVDLAAAAGSKEPLEHFGKLSGFFIQQMDVDYTVPTKQFRAIDVEYFQFPAVFTTKEYVPVYKYPVQWEVKVNPPKEK